MKILIIGFQRGGTTLLRRLFDAHPDVKYMLHEKRIMNRPNSVLRDVEGTWGEKVPWNSATGDEIITYVRKWLKLYGDEARILHIVRHPVDVGLSNQKLGWMSLQQAVNSCISSIPKVIKSLQGDRYKALTFEELVTDPKNVLKSLFTFCDIDDSDETLEYIASLKQDKLRYFDGINADRAFVYKKQDNLNCRIPNYKKLTQLIRRD